MRSEDAVFMANDSVCGQTASPGEDVYSVTFPCTLKKKQALGFSGRGCHGSPPRQGARCIKARVRAGTATNTARGREARRDTVVAAGGMLLSQDTDHTQSWAAGAPRGSEARQEALLRPHSKLEVPVLPGRVLWCPEPGLTLCGCPTRMRPRGVPSTHGEAELLLRLMPRLHIPP